MEAKGRLYVVATPIGNLGDITLRALEILKTADAVACEDTRHTQKLLNHFKIHPSEVFSLHKFNEKSRVEKVARLLEQGKNVALVSDAGTPALADPGHALIRAITGRGFAAEPLPGPSALAAALSASGMDTDRFVFEGFLPPKGKARKESLAALKDEVRTLAFYEAPHRLEESLRDMLEILGNRPAVLAREITKLHEEMLRADLRTLLETVQGREKSRGEIVLIVEGCKTPFAAAEKPAGDPVAAVRELESREGLSRRDAIRRVAEQFGISRQDLYRAAGEKP